MPTRTHRPDATEGLADAAPRADPGARRRDGDDDPGPSARRGGLPRRALRVVRPGDLAGDNDLLSLTNPDVIRAIHRVLPRRRRRHHLHQHVQRHADLAGRLRPRGPLLRAERRGRGAGPRGGRRGRHAPTGRASSPGRWARPPRRPRSRPTSTTPAPATSPSTSWSAAYLEEARGLVDGGADLLLIETIFDTLNAKAAIFALETLFDEHGRRWPVIVSGTITDASGRTLSGQVTEAFWNSVRHVRPLAIGLNCALGAEELRPYVAELSRVADSFVSAHPNAGLPNAFGEYDETPDHMAEVLGEFADQRAGQHRRRLLRHDGRAHRGDRRRRQGGGAAGACPRSPPAMRLSGLEPVTITDESLFVNVGERTNITGSARFRKLIKDGDYDAALTVAAQQVEAGAQVIDVNMDEGMIDGVAAMDRFLKLVASEPDISRVPVMVDSSKWEVIEAGLKCVQGKAIVNSISMKEGEEAFIEHARLCRRYGAAAVVMAFDEDGQADSLERRTAVCAARLPDPHRAGRLPGRGHHLRPQRVRGGDRHRGARDVRTRLHRGHPLDQAEPARRAGLGRHLQRQLLVPGQQPRPRGDPRGVPVPRDRGRPRHGHRQRRRAGRLRPGRPRAARADRGRRPQPASGRGRAAARDRRAVQHRGRRGRGGRARSGASSPSRSGSRTPWSRASTRTSSPTPRSCGA